MMKIERLFKKKLQMQRLFHLILVVAIIMIFSFSCGTEKVVVKDETKKIEQAKSGKAVSTEETERAKEAEQAEKSERTEEVSVKGLNLWVKGWNVLIYSNASYDSGVVGMVARGIRLSH